MTDSNNFSLILHGGAGPRPGADYSEVEAHLKQLAIEGEAMLRGGAGAVDVVEAMVSALEASGLYVAGRGSGPNSAGYVELDASIMDGATGNAGGVTCIRDARNPVIAARKVLDHSPYVLLAGEGATRFALTHGVDFVRDDEDWYRVPVGVTAEQMQEEELAHGTVGAVAMDQQGRLAAATSTGGLFGKPEGRVGDTGIIGAGTWASPDIAISCTGLGEHFILAGGARSIADRIKFGGMAPVDAVQSFLNEIEDLGGDGGVIAVTRTGEIVSAYNSDGMKEARVGRDFGPISSTFS